MIPHIEVATEKLTQAISNALLNHTNITKTLPILSDCFNDLTSTLKWIEPFKINIQPNDEHILPYGCSHVKAINDSGILIRQADEEKFLFFYEGYWFLYDDEYADLRALAKELSEWTALSQTHSVHAVKKMIDKNYR